MTAIETFQLSTPSELLVGQHVRIPLRNGSSTRPISFDHAASTPALQAVRTKTDAFLQWYSSVHRGTGFSSQLSTRVYEEARDIVGQFVGARPDQHVVIFGANTTWAINKLARRIGFKSGQVVITSELEHHANDLPWRQVAEVVYARCDERGQLDEAHVAELLREYAGRVRLLAITGASNVTGYISNIHHLATLAHAAGAEIAVDAAQLAPHRSIDIGDLADPAHIDYLAFSAHKLYAPYGSGALIGRRDTFAKGVPDVVGGGTVKQVTTTEVVWADAPGRDEAGTPNVVGVVALAAAVRELQRIGLDALAAHEAALTEELLARLAQVPGLTIYGDNDPTRAAERLGVVPFTIEGIDPRLVGAILSCEYGIAVRCGAFCAHPYVRRLTGADASCSGPQVSSLIRASLGLANTIEDVHILADALTAIARGAYVDEYEFDEVESVYYPRDWRPDTTAAFSLV